MKTGAEAAPKKATAKPPQQKTSQKSGEKPFFAPSIQAKLKVGSPNDPAEKEADNMADKVMRAPSGGKATPSPNSTAIEKPDQRLINKEKEQKNLHVKQPAGKAMQPAIKEPAADKPVQMKAAGQEDKVQKKETAKPEEKLQKKEATKPEDKVQKKEVAKTEERVQKKETTKPEDKVQKKELTKPEDKVQKKEATKQEDKVQKKETTKPEEQVQKKEAPTQKKEDEVQRKGEGTPSSAMNDLGEGIRQQGNSGHALSDDTKSFMEHRFNADFSNVRIHSGPEASRLSSDAGARAFTYQNHIFFNKNEYQPGTSGGKHLLAHELTHVVQQGQSVQRSEAPAAAAVAPQVQRWELKIPTWDDALDWLSEKAHLLVPGFRMFTIVVGTNPITQRSVDTSAANVLRAIVEFLPGGNVIVQALEKYSVFEKAGSWVEGKLKKFSNLIGQIVSGLIQFKNELDLSDIVFSPGKTWDKAVSIFSTPVNDVISFIKGLFEEIMQFIRDAVLKPLAALAANSAGFDLLCAVIGFNPITNEAVPPTADNLIGGFMKMIGRQDIWDNIKKGNAVDKAYAWFQKAMKGIVAIVKSFPQDFIAMLKSLEVMDFIILPNLFKKVFGVFGGFVVTFTNWAMNTIFDLLEIIFSVVAPGAMPYLQKVRGAFKSILEKPMVFVGHLVNAAKQGFNQFKNRFGSWLKKGLIDWLLGSLKGANIYIPQAFTLKEIIKLGLSVFGLTWQNVRGKLVKVMGETAVAAMETGFDLIQTLITEGPAAAWDKMQDKIEELKAQFISEVTSYITVTVVQAAVVKLLSSLNPAGAFIQSIIAIYNTIMFLVNKIQQIASVGMAVIDSMVEIAGGAIGKAANKVESVLGGMLSLAISFLANFLGLGKISDKIVTIIKKLRAPVDKAIDKVIDWIVKAGKSFLTKLKDKLMGWLKIRKTFAGEDQQNHSVYFNGKDESAEVFIASTPKLAGSYLTEMAALHKDNGKIVGNARRKLNEIAKVKRTAANDKAADDAKKAKLETLFQELAGILSGLKGTSGMKDEMDEVTVTFVPGSDYDADEIKEFNQQVNAQLAGLRKMTLDNWMANRYAFEQKGRDRGSLDRAKTAAIKQRYIELTAKFEAEISKENPKPAPSAIERRAKSKARTALKKELKGQAMLHLVDQVAGGEGDVFMKNTTSNVSGHGTSRINSLVGNNWKQEVPKIVDSVKKVNPKKLKTAKMKVKK